MTATLLDDCRRMGRMPWTGDPGEMEDRRKRAARRRLTIKALSSWGYGTVYFNHARDLIAAALRTTAPIRETWKADALRYLKAARKDRIGRAYHATLRKHHSAMKRRRATA